MLHYSFEKVMYINVFINDSFSLPAELVARASDFLSRPY